MGETDGDLMAAVRRGETRALNELVRRHLRRVVAYIYKYTADWHDAEDIALQVFHEIHATADRFDTGRDFLPWLFTVVHRRTIDNLRRRKPEAISLEHMEDAVELPDAPVGDDRIVTLRSILRSLPPQDQSLLYLRYHENLSSKRIGEIAGLSSNTVDARISRIRNKLRSLLQ